MNHAGISIIVPVYNVARYLDRCISSIVNQTYNGLQIILVDDGSSDGSSRICDQYKAADSRIFVIHKQNGGLVSARKEGLRAASGAYVGYVDGDDWIEPDFYEKLLGYMIQYDADMVETEHFVDAGTASQRIRGGFPYGKYNTGQLIPKMLCDRDFNECRLKPYLWSKLFKKSLLDRCQMEVDEAVVCGEDIAVAYPYVLGTESIYIADYAGYHYVQREDSMTGLRGGSDWRQNKALANYLKNVFEKAGENRAIMMQQLNQYVKSMLLLRQIDFFDRDSSNKKLIPFGGVELADRIALYGAGRMGRSVYHYLKTLNTEIVSWGDKEYLLYQQLGLPVTSPDEIVSRQECYDVLLIAASSRKTSDAIREYLTEKGMRAEKMIWLTEQFISDGGIVDSYIDSHGRKTYSGGWTDGERQQNQ